MNTYTVSFFGHRYLTNLPQVEEKLDKLVRDLIGQHEYVSFLVGRDGEFDLAATSAVHRCKRLVRSDNSSLTWILPYCTAEFTHNEDSFREFYDEIEIYEKATATHYKAAFQARNRNMVDRADLIVFYVEHKSGGAYQTMKYATKKEKYIINLGSEDVAK